MKATKYTVTFEVEVLSLSTVCALVQRALNEVQNEFVVGELQADDGDKIAWDIVKKEVEF